MVTAVVGSRGTSPVPLFLPKELTASPAGLGTAAGALGRAWVGGERATARGPAALCWEMDENCWERPGSLECLGGNQA